MSLLGANYVFGYSLNSDAKALNQDSERYGLESIDYDFYDIKAFYKQFSNTHNDTFVTNILGELHIEGEKRIAEKRHDYIKTFLEEIRSKICAEK